MLAFSMLRKADEPMKKFLCALTSLVMLLAVACASAETVDAYTSASTTKTLLSGDDLAAAETLLASHSSDLATKAEASAEGYTAPADALNAQIMSVNPDGSVGLSTISEWKLTPAADGAAATVTLELTYGQNALNLSEDGARGTLLVGVDGTWYIVHLKVLNSDEQVYSDEAYEAGEFDHHYSGSDSKLSSYTIDCEVLSIETSFLLMF